MIKKISIQIFLTAIFNLIIILSYGQNSQFEGKVTYKHSRTSSQFDGMLDSMGRSKDSISIWAISKDNLVAKYINSDGYINTTYVRMGDDNSFIYYPDSYIMDYNQLPNVTNYIFKKKYKKKEEILGYKCTKYEFTLNKNTKIFFWVADDIKLKNHGDFFNFISKKNRLVLKRELIWEGEGNSYEAIKIESEVTEDDFNFAY